MRNLMITLMAVAAVALLAGPAQGAVVYDGADGGWATDTWNTASNWNSGAGPVPSGTTDVEIAADKHPSVMDATPSYTGNLELKNNAWLEIGQTSEATALNVLGTGTITMNSGTDLTMRYTANSTHSQNLHLAGDALFAIGRSTSAHWKERTWDGEISGSGLLTVLTTNGQTLNLTNTNTWSGGLAAGGSLSQNNERIRAQAVGALGTGDVTIDSGVSLHFEANEVMDNGATLTLNGSTGRDANFLTLAAGTNTTVANLVVDGTALGPGMYDSTSGLTDSNGNPLIGGDGTLTAVIPEPASLMLLGLGGLGVMLRRRGRK